MWMYTLHEAVPAACVSQGGSALSSIDGSSDADASSTMRGCCNEPTILVAGDPAKNSQTARLC